MLQSLVILQRYVNLRDDADPSQAQLIYIHTVPCSLDQVPGVGPAAAKALASGDDPNEKITNTFQLIGK